MATLFDEVRSFLKQNGIALKHALGQNFLTDDNVLAAIVEAAEIRKSDTVVEIGPGIGILTRELMKRAGRVTSIEIDATLIPLLKKFTGWSPEGNLTIIEGNALTAAMPQNPYKIVANIPYHITSPLLRHVFRESVVRPSSLTLLMQREVAEKICNPSDAGLLTILVGLFGMPSIVTRVPAAAFLPPPNVESAVLHIAAFTTPRGSVADIDNVFRLTKMAFSGKRKMLRNTVGHDLVIKAAFDRADIDLSRRPQTLSIDEWLTVAHHLDDTRKK